MRLKIYISVICMVFLTVSVQAKKVEADQAERLAQRYLQSKRQVPRETPVRLKYVATPKQQTQKAASAAGAVRTHVQDTDTDTVYYYVFNVNENAGGGFVIVAGDDVVRPVLGYSDNGSYDENNLPPNVAWWMDGLQQQIAYTQSQNLPQSEAVRNEWESYSDGNISYSASSAAPLIQTKWNQDSPYNNLCPMIGEITAPTGCVATAMA